MQLASPCCGFTSAYKNTDQIFVLNDYTVSKVCQSSKVLNRESLYDQCSPTLTALLSTVSPKFSNSLSNAMVGHIVTGHFSGHHTRLQLALGLMVNSKTKNEQFQAFVVTASPKECRRYKISAAAVYNNEMKSGLDGSKGLIQIVTDNFDGKSTFPEWDEGHAWVSYHHHAIMYLTYR